MIVSADVTPEGREECMDAGADGFLGKPVEAARLLTEVQRIATAAQTSVPAPIPRPQTRITSYNVCYTKLLRVGRSRQDAQGEVQRRSAGARAEGSYNFV